ncbi:MAG: iron ABC transporter permease [Planctomycetes bacterium]|nr:iron ABC transporter permease [Planctomycetota bacterium]
MRSAAPFIALAALLALAILAGILTGSKPFDLTRAIDDPDSGDRDVFREIRLPRVVFAAIAGAGLALAGAVFQGLFRNSLATPFTLGISGGASLGAVLAIRLGLDIAFLGISTVPLAAFAGSLVAVGAVWLLARRGSRISTATLLLAGVTLHFLFGAAVLLVQHLANPYRTAEMFRWMAGSLDVVGMGDPARVLPLAAAGSLACLLFARELDLLAAGEELAASRGVAVGRARMAVLLAASFSTASIVSHAGPIPFVGLVVPHAVRLILGPGHRRLLPATLLAGAAFLVLADAACRWLGRFGAGEFPIGVLTALLGAPAFLWILYRQGEGRG